MHQGGIRFAAFSPDDRIILTTSDDKTAQLWQADSGKPIGMPILHPSVVVAEAFSPDGRTVLMVSVDGTSRLWDVATAKPLGPPIATPSIHVKRGAVAFSPDGRTVFIGNQLWDVTELPDDLPRVAAWVEAITGLRVDEQGDIRALDGAGWQERVRRLETLGGRPQASRWLLDPFLGANLHGPAPGPSPIASAGQRLSKRSTRPSASAGSIGVWISAADSSPDAAWPRGRTTTSSKPLASAPAAMSISTSIS